ncbi:MAG: glycosyltransferase [Ruminococcaceae bacterium]|nr:glycosyltransferase [Oscillospiraceae bacterium]
MEITADIKVSVIMPIYNAASYLRPALDSALDQTLSEIEIICVDDGSTDNSLEIIKEYQERDGRVRIITETNAGIGLARNNGMRRARGEYIAFLDADDFAEPAFLETLYNIAIKDNLDIAIAGYDLYNSRKSRFEPVTEAENSNIFKQGKVTSKNEYPDHILSSTTGAAWNKLFRRSFVEEKGLHFLQDVRIYEDVFFVTSAMSLAERVEKIDKVMIHHRIHSEQARVKFLNKYYHQIPFVYLKIKEFLVHNGMYAPLFRSYLNLSASRSNRIFNRLTGDEKKNFWNILHNEYAELLGWQGKDASDFDSDELCRFVVFVQLYNFDEYKRRLNRKGELRVVGNVKQNIEIAKKKRRFRAFLSRIFKKNY